MKEATGYFLLVMVGTGTGGRPGRRKGSGTVSLALNGVCQRAAGTRHRGDMGGPSRATSTQAPPEPKKQWRTLEVHGAEQHQARLGGQLCQQPGQAAAGGLAHPGVDALQVQALVAAQLLRQRLVETLRLVQEAGLQGQGCAAEGRVRRLWVCPHPCCPPPAGTRLTWVVEDLRGGQQPGHGGQLLQGSVHAPQPRWVAQDGGQALLGLTPGTCR